MFLSFIPVLLDRDLPPELLRPPLDFLGREDADVLDPDRPDFLVDVDHGEFVGEGLIDTISKCDGVLALALFDDDIFIFFIE